MFKMGFVSKENLLNWVLSFGDSVEVIEQKEICLELRNHEQCGSCSNFPCSLLNQFAYDENQGDDGKRIEQCRKWCLR